MTDDPYADPELRAALGALIVDEPPAPSVVDDVARGRALRHRRRARAGAVAGLAAVVLGVVAVGAALRPVAPVEPAAGEASSASAASASELADRVRPVLASMGWTVLGAESAAADGRSEIHLTIAQTGSPEVTSALWILGSSPDATLTVPYLAGCTDESCPGDRQMTIADGITATSGYEEQGATSWSLDPPGRGARMLDRAYGTGSLVEVVAVPRRSAPPAVSASPSLGSGSAASPATEPSFDPEAILPLPAPLLTFRQLSRVITALGDPFAARPGPQPVPTTLDATVPPCTDADVKLTPAIGSDGTTSTFSMIVEVHARNPQVRCTVAGTPTIELRGSDGRTLPFTVLEPGPAAASRVLVTQDTTPAARLRIVQPLCPLDTGTPSTSLRLTLPGETVASNLEFPAGVGPTYCPDAGGATTIRVTSFVAGQSATDQPMAPAPGIATTGLRGAAVGSSTCPDPPVTDIEAPVAITGTVSRIWVCPATGVGEPPPGPGRAGEPVDLGDVDTVQTLLRELGRADEPTSVSASCRGYLDSPRTVLVETGDGLWSAHLPRDACEHYSRALATVLSTALG